MNPYRIEAEKNVPLDEPPVHESDIAIVWVWLGIGAIMIGTDAGRPGPWGAASSLGMLLSGLALIALWQYYVAAWRHRRAARNAARNWPEV